VRKISLEASRFLLIGLLSVCVDWVTYSLLHLLCSLPIWADKSISFFFGTILSFVLNGLWTFHSKLSLKKLEKHLSTYGLSLIVNVSINQMIFINYDSSNKLIVAVLVATVFSSFLNFFGLKYWVFTESRRIGIQ
jgi:putative flippase GtrA